MLVKDIRTSIIIGKKCINCCKGLTGPSCCCSRAVQRNKERSVYFLNINTYIYGFQEFWRIRTTDINWDWKTIWINMSIKSNDTPHRLIISVRSMDGVTWKNMMICRIKVVQQQRIDNTLEMKEIFSPLVFPLLNWAPPNDPREAVREEKISRKNSTKN